MAFLKPDKIEYWNGVKMNYYFLTQHNVNKISLPSTPMPDSKKLGVTIHNTPSITTASGTTQSEQYTRSTVNGNMKSSIIHIYVDETEAWINMPFDISSWHAADGSGPGNTRTISIECIMGSEYGTKSEKAEDNAARIIGYLFDKYNWNLTNLFTHTHWLAVQMGRTGTRQYLNETKLGNGKKWCPVYILPHFTNFEKKVASYMTLVKPNNPITNVDDKTESSSYTVKLLSTDKIYNNITEHKVVGTVGKDGVYTITETSGDYGKLKSGAGWVIINSSGSTEPTVIKVGDNVKVLKAIQYNGNSFKVYASSYKVLELKGDRAVISSDGKNVTAAVNIVNLQKI